MNYLGVSRGGEEDTILSTVDIKVIKSVEFHLRCYPNKLELSSAWVISLG